MRESSISREHARKILASLNRLDEYDPLNDYYLVTDENGEHLWIGGMDQPEATNADNMSWYTPAWCS
jgi:hypothetical protein